VVFRIRAYCLLPAGDGRRCAGVLIAKGHFKHGYMKRKGQWYVSDAFIKIDMPINFDYEVDSVKLPLITVITVVFNGEAFLERTILSVINQTYSNIEYIIIDGGSTDGTLAIIGKYEHVIDYWVSEKDEGIYDAMNKGIVLASGQWINFMNSGDHFYENKTVSEIIKNCSLDADFLMGDVLIQNNEKSKVVSAVSNAKYSMPTCHQSIFTRKDILNSFLFDTHFKVGADFNQFVRITSASNAIRITFFNGIIAIITAGGYSAQNEAILQQDYFQTIRTYRGLLPSLKFILGRNIMNTARLILAKCGFMTI
jgi:glycosyltransferase involved in cell wall biosynthesis